MHYPPTRATSQVDNYNGVAVADPYRWLEDDNSPETLAWVQAQNKVTFDFLDRIPQREAIRNTLTHLWNYERYGVPFKRGGRYFISKNDGLQNQSVIYTMPSLDAPPIVLIDPNKLSADGTVALSGLAVSHDGNLMAYGLSASGSDWEEWHVRDVRTGQDLSDVIKWVKFSNASWTLDGKGFFYSRFDAPSDGTRLSSVNKFQKLYYHLIGTPQSQDPLIYQRADHDDWGFDASVTEDGHYLVINVSQGTDPRNRVFYLDLTQPGSPVVELLNDFDAAYNFIDNDGPIFWFQTDLNAPRSRIIAVDITHPQRADWREIVPQSADTLQDVATLNNSFLCSYLKDAHSQVRIFSLEGKPLGELPLPALGSAGGFTGHRDDTDTFYSFTSFTFPGTIYHYDLATGANTVFRQPKVDFNPADYVTEQVFYASKDGTRVPMFIVHKKGIQLDGNNPTLLYGYGGFNITTSPAFSSLRIALLEQGVVYVSANIRGGAEYGEKWHEAGTKLVKQNVFDDFIAAAQYLIDNKYTSPQRLGIQGASNGGLLVGAVANQRPDLFKVVVQQAGVMDMLRFQKFTIGWNWIPDYGSSTENEAEFKALRAYSPIHNIKDGAKYPATLITTADHDDRVVPAHSFKYAAVLQHGQGGDNPILIRIDTHSGHGASSTTKAIEQAADIYSFIFKNLGVTPTY